MLIYNKHDTKQVAEFLPTNCIFSEKLAYRLQYDIDKSLDSLYIHNMNNYKQVKKQQ